MHRSCIRDFERSGNVEVVATCRYLAGQISEEEPSSWIGSKHSGLDVITVACLGRDILGLTTFLTGVVGAGTPKGRVTSPQPFFHTV